jgi:hypothetical protein
VIIIRPRFHPEAVEATRQGVVLFLTKPLRGRPWSVGEKELALSPAAIDLKTDAWRLDIIGQVGNGGIAFPANSWPKPTQLSASG